MNVDLQNTQFGFFWYNDEEIFRASQEELSRRAENLAGTGINHVITFSCTHFRWSFRRHWEVITDALARVVKACHAHDVRVTEHHSSHLTFNPLNEDDEQWAERVLNVRGSSMSSWPHFREDCDADPEIEGAPLSSFRQIDGRTGQWARSNYRGWCMCFNNPDYRRAYFQYLETLYAVGIDGIMTDDVQWFGAANACACEHCRARFEKEMGYELPPAGPEWEAWHGEYDEPSYVAWLDFRYSSNRDFHAAVKAHYGGLGLRPLRPNYVSGVYGRNPTAYVLDDLPDLDWVFVECCFSAIIRYCWPAYATETAHRYSVGRWRDIPAMAMFYPDRPDTMLFTWALAMSWGVKFLATPEGFSLNEEEKRLRDFEQEHSKLLQSPRKLARIGFYDSRTNRHLYRDADRSILSQVNWMRACYLTSTPFDIILEEELHRFGEYDAVVLNEVAILTDEQARALADFAAGGGTLVWVGKTGTRREHGRPRHPDVAHDLFGLPQESIGHEPDIAGAHEVGRGKLVTVPASFAGEVGDIPPAGLSADRWQETEVRVPFRPPTGKQWQTCREVAEILTDLLPEGPDLQIDHLPPGVIATVFESADRSALALHLINTAGTLELPQSGDAGHRDPIPFPSHAGGDPILFRIRAPERPERREQLCAMYHDPEKGDPRNLPVETDGQFVSVTVDPSLIRAYGLIEIPWG